MTHNLKAGYLCDAVLDLLHRQLKSDDEPEGLTGLLSYASCFDVSWPEGFLSYTPEEKHPYLA